MLLGKKIINSVNLLSRSQYVGYQRLISSMADQDDEKEEQLQLNNHNVKDQSKTLSEPIESVSQLLMGADMSNAYPRVLSAQSLPIIGNMQPPLFKVMDDISTGLQYLFQTESPYTAALSGGQICGMEACLFNLLQPGEKLLVLNMGEIGKRAVDIGERAGLEIVNFSQDPGQTFSLQEVRQAIETWKPNAVFACQGEPSTGVYQPLSGLGEICHEGNALLIVDAAYSLGGVPFHGDDWGVDCAYSTSQNCLSAAPGTSPLFLSVRAMEKLVARELKVGTLNMDLTEIGRHWKWFTEGRRQLDVSPVSLYFGLRESLQIINKVGLEHSWRQHAEMQEMLWEGLDRLGLECFVENTEHRLPTVNAINIPQGVDHAALIKNAMSKYGVEISEGVGETAGKCWRVGIMGFNATPQNIEMLIMAFKDGLQKQGYV